MVVVCTSQIELAAYLGDRCKRPSEKGDRRKDVEEPTRSRHRIEPDRVPDQIKQVGEDPEANANPNPPVCRIEGGEAGNRDTHHFCRDILRDLRDYFATFAVRSFSVSKSSGR